MKKIVKIVSCLTMCLSFTGCFSSLYTRNTTNVISTCSECSKVSDINSLVNNIEVVMESVDAIKGSYKLVNTKKTFLIDFEAITKDKKANWDMYAKTSIDSKNIEMYLKDSKIYLIYPNNGANVIMKDDFNDIVVEVEKTLDALNATYDKENLEEIILGDKLEGFNFDILKENATYIKNSDNSYTITNINGGLTWQLDVGADYLIKEVRCSASNFNSTLKLTYPEALTVSYPMGIDFLTVDVEDVKKLLEIDNFGQIIDEDLKG